MTEIKFEQWCILEIFGHQRYAGLVTEQSIGGASFVRIDVPAVGATPAFTKLFGGSSIYAITPVEESVARSVAESIQQKPFEVWEISKLLDQAEENRRKKLEIASGDRHDPDFDDDEEDDYE